MHISTELIVDPEICDIPYDRLVAVNDFNLLETQEEDPAFKYFVGNQYRYVRLRFSVDGSFSFKTMQIPVAEVSLKENALNPQQYEAIIQEMDQAFNALMHSGALTSSELPSSQEEKHHQGTSLNLNLEQLRNLEEIKANLPLILHIHAETPYVIVHLNDSQQSETVYRLSLKQVISVLQSNKLLQIHRSHLVNPNQPWRLNSVGKRHQLVLLRSKKEVVQLPVGIRFLEEVKNHFS